MNEGSVSPTTTARRESREFFYVYEDFRVAKVTGYICENTPNYWWCPEVGFSAAEGVTLFRQEEDALARAHMDALKAFYNAEANLRRAAAAIGGPVS